MCVAIATASSQELLKLSLYQVCSCSLPLRQISLKYETRSRLLELPQSSSPSGSCRDMSYRPWLKVEDPGWFLHLAPVVGLIGVFTADNGALLH